MPTIAQTLMIVTALGVWSGVSVTVLIFLWNKLDKRLDDQNNKLDKRIDDLRDDVKALRAKVDDLPLKIVEMLSKAPR